MCVPSKLQPSFLILLMFLSMYLVMYVRALEGDEIADYNWNYKGFSVEELLEERAGFGGKVTGGLYGKVYHVTTLADSGPGSLRWGAESEEPLWIVFDVNGVIELNSNIEVKSNKTIDGRGAEIVITGYGLRIKGVSNVIIVNIRFDTAKDVTDAIEIRGSHDIWIHHCDITNYSDGALDIVRQSTNITVSWCRFWNHNKVMLIGNDPEAVEDKIIQVTLHHNFFYKTVQRTPRLRFGKVDIYNNYYFGWKSYAIGVELGGQVLVESNIFEAEGSTRVLNQMSNEEPGYVKLVNNRFLNGAAAQEYEPEKVFNRSDYYTAIIEPADDALKERIMAFAGAKIPADIKIMTNHKLSHEDFQWKSTLTDPILAGTKINLYAVDPPPRHPSEEIVSYEWDFGDGSKGFGMAAPHIYKTPGAYTITLTLKNKAGAIINISANITVISESPSHPYSKYLIAVLLVTIILIGVIIYRILKRPRFILPFLLMEFHLREYKF
ncbi:PKD domain-containing protein [Candidatus Bathyarchaeota archaeon]|nr:PKD domain-containing protein [Candidatus Bathyarchaeota archaeon]